MGLRSYDNGLTRWPLLRNPYYDTEPDDGMDAAYYEWRMECVAHEAEGLERRAWELDGDNLSDLAEPYIDLAESRWREYKRIQQQLNNYLGGF